MKKDISLYIHIPFCRQKCSYCDFVSSAQSEVAQTNYISLLCNEILAWKEYLSDRTIKTIFIGGGTPSILSVSNMQTLFQTLHSLYIPSKTEFSMECNPESVTLEKLSCMKQNAINRLSIGLQSTHQKELQLLGRCHSYDQFLYAYDLIQKSGFDNLNIDLMFALPNQTIREHIHSLQRVISLKPNHISAYSLILEDGTYLKKQVDHHYYEIPSEEEYIGMYRNTIHLLEINGYEQYEISNFSKQFHECQHNIVYWERGDYIGFGVSASSFVDGKRFTNPMSLQEYSKSTFHTPKKIAFMERIDLEEAFEETIFLGLRMNKGLSISWLKKQFPNFTGEPFQKTLSSLQNRGLIHPTENNLLRLTQEGIEISNQVFLEILL